MTDNVTLTIINGEKTVNYFGVICESIAEASSLLHPSYWEEIPVGMKMLLDNGTKIFMRYAENIMLIRVNHSRNFVQIANQ